MLTPAELRELADMVAERLAEKLASRPKLVDAPALAEMLGLGVATIERRKRDGTIPHVKVGRRVLYRPDAVIAALETKATAGN